MTCAVIFYAIFVVGLQNLQILIRKAVDLDGFIFCRFVSYYICLKTFGLFLPTRRAGTFSRKKVPKVRKRDTTPQKSWFPFCVFCILSDIRKNMPPRHERNKRP